MTLKQSFVDFVFSTSTDGSGKAASCVRALDMPRPILARHYPHPAIKGTMWQRFSPADIQAIQKWICGETKKEEGGKPSVSTRAVDDYAKESLNQTGFVAR